jgi:hypothetical protein
MAEQPPLSRIHVVGYSANDRDYPILNLVLDPRVAGYQVPKDLSACPDKRYPNHVFTGAQPISGDQRVRHVWEILPSPWVPFTRYDDDLGPVQGRRRSVKNDGQVASREADKQVTYDAREGSAIVYTELEETWSIKTDEDGNSLFPIRDRDFYDASRGPVQERRQLFVPTGEEVGSLENVNGVITQTSYEPYNDFLSIKIVQTYMVDGPQLIGNATDNDGQLVTVTTQRKGADGYIPPNPTATRTVEVSREDAESLIERVSTINTIFASQAFSIEKPDPLPQKFRVAAKTETTAENVEGQANPTLTLSESELAKSEQQVNRFIKRISTTERSQKFPITLTQKETNENQQIVTVTETAQFGDSPETPTATKTISSEALGDGTYLIRKSEIPSVFSAKSFRKTKDDPTPAKFRSREEDLTTEETLAGVATDNFDLEEGEFSKSEQQVTGFIKRISTTSRTIEDLPKSFSQKTTTNEGLLATVTETLQEGDAEEGPTAITSIRSEALGNGNYLVTTTELPKVFENKTIQVTKPDLTPEKFRAAQKDTTIEETIEGKVNPDPSLGTGEFRKSEQQVTEFVKRVSTTSRDTVATSTLEEKIVTNQGQLATRTLTISAQGQSIGPDALLVDGSIEALGDGRTIKTEVRVGEVFDNKTISVSRPDSLPSKFRISVPTKTEQEVVAQESVSVPTLEANDLQKTEEKITDFTVRKSTVSSIGGVIPDIASVDYDEAFGISLPFVEKITTSIPDNINSDVESLGGGRYLVREYDLETLGSELGSFRLTYPTRVNLNLPDVLKSISVEWETDQSVGLFDSDNSLEGTFKSVSIDDRGTTSASISATPKFNIDIEEIFAQNLVARVDVFFLKGPISQGNILGAVGASQWPVFKPQSHTITAFSKKITASVGASVSASSQETEETSGKIRSRSKQTESGFSSTPIIVNIPSCLSSEISINSVAPVSGLTISATAKILVVAPVSQTNTVGLTMENSVNRNIPATSPTDVPRSGRYLVDSDVEFFKFGWFLVKATTFDAGQLA